MSYIESRHTLLYNHHILIFEVVCVRWICLEFANLDLHNEIHFSEWVRRTEFVYGKKLNDWLWMYIENIMYLDVKKAFGKEVSKDIHYELNRIMPTLFVDEELRLDWLYEKRQYLVDIQEELKQLIGDLAKGQEFARELDGKFQSNYEIKHSINLSLQEQLNEKFKKVTFGIVPFKTEFSSQWMIRPLVDDFETLLYADLMKYINDLQDLIFCNRCNKVIEKPMVGQLRNYRRGVGAYCEPCGVIHQREKNNRIKRNSRRREKYDKYLGKK